MRDILPYLLFALYLTTPIVSFFFVYLAAGNLRILTPLTVWWLSFVFVIYGQSFSIYMKFADDPSSIYYFFAIQLGMIIVPAGSLMANIITGFRPKIAFGNFISRPIKGNLQRENVFILIFLSFAVLSLFAMIEYFIAILSFTDIPLLSQIGHVGGISGAKSRLDATNLLPHFWRYNYVYLFVLPFLTLIAFVKSFSKNGNIKTKKWKLIFIFLASFTFLISLLLLVKESIVLLMLMFFVAILLIKSDINYRILVYFFAVVIGSLTSLYYILIGFRESYFVTLTTIFGAIYNRITLGYSESLFYAFKLFPDKHDFLYGLSFPNPGHILPFEPFSLSRFIYDYSNGMLSGGSSPVIFFGEMYANFGFIGMIASMIFVGILLQFIYIHMITREKTAVGMAFLSITTSYSYYLAVTSLFQFFEFIGLLYLFFIILEYFPRLR